MKKLLIFTLTSFLLICCSEEESINDTQNNNVIIGTYELISADEDGSVFFDPSIGLGCVETVRFTSQNIEWTYYTNSNCTQPTTVTGTYQVTNTTSLNQVISGNISDNFFGGTSDYVGTYFYLNNSNLTIEIQFQSQSTSTVTYNFVLN